MLYEKGLIRKKDCLKVNIVSKCVKRCSLEMTL